MQRERLAEALARARDPHRRAVVRGPRGVAEEPRREVAPTERGVRDHRERDRRAQGARSGAPSAAVETTRATSAYGVSSHASCVAVPRRMALGAWAGWMDRRDPVDDRASDGWGTAIDGSTDKAKHRDQPAGAI